MASDSGKMLQASRGDEASGSSRSLDAVLLAEGSWDAVAAQYSLYWVDRLRPFRERAVALFHPVASGPLAVPGCGPGAEVLRLADLYPARPMVATDISGQMVGLLWRHLRERALSSVVASQGAAENLSAFVRRAAGIFCCFTLELLSNPLAALADWSRALGPRGSIIAVVFATKPRPGSAAARLQAAIQARIGEARLLWEARAFDALPRLGLRLTRDEVLEHEVLHSSPQEYFRALVEAGPLQVLLRKFGPERLAEVREMWLSNHGLRRDGSSWVDVCQARIWVLERPDEG